MTFKTFVFLFFIIFNSIQGKSLRYLLNHDTYPAVTQNRLDLSNLKLTSIDGIDKYPGIKDVEELVLRDNKLRSIKPLSLLRKYNIKKIDLASNRIRDVRSLAALSILQELYIEYNLVSFESINYVISKLRNLRIVAHGNPIGQQFELPIPAQEPIEEEVEQPRLNKIIIVKMENPSNDITCSICLCGNEDEGLYATICEHVFHKNCLQRWANACKHAKKHTTCPCCRIKLSPKKFCILEAVE